MSISDFTKPSDNEVLKKLVENDLVVSFVGNGNVHQKKNETLYYRTVKIKVKGEETLRNVVYVKNGVSWKFKCTEKADYNA